MLPGMPPTATEAALRRRSHASKLHFRYQSAKLHFVSESATTLENAGRRSARRSANAHRITRCAQRLADERGLDGFTMDELADEAGVSRRTLFNYFPGKDDAVLGGLPEPDPDELATFRAGGPTGNLVDDMSVLIHGMLEAKGTSREEISRAHRVMEANPKLMALAHQRFREFTEEFLADVRTREGSAYDDQRAQLALGLLAGLFALTLDAYIHHRQDGLLADLYTQNLRIARELLG